MRRLLTLIVLIVSALTVTSNGSALTAGTTLSCSFSATYGTPAWSDATGAPVGTKTVCSKTTLTFDHQDQQCRGGQLYSVPIYFGTAQIDFYLGRATAGTADSGGFYSAVRSNVTPVFSIGIAAGFVEDDDNMVPLGTACAT
jgi:hypothetical protein